MIKVIMCGYVLTMAILIASFSLRYMKGESIVRRFWFYYTLTIASVLTFIITNNIFVFIIGWLMMNLGITRLVALYHNIYQAQKFKVYILKILMCNTLLIFLAFLIGFHYTQTVNINLLTVTIEQHPVITQLFAIMLALSAFIQCAQFPFHKWLLNSMIAPTPVSALMHAGIVNAGGLLLIRFHGVLNHSLYAQVLITILATTSIIYSTYSGRVQPTIKGVLGASTSAQMGFMLLQCAFRLISDCIASFNAPWFL